MALRMTDNYENISAQSQNKVLLMFGSVLKALQAEKVLKVADIACELLVPPLELRTGCDLAIALDSYEATFAKEVVEKAGLVITDERLNTAGTAQLSDVVTTHDFEGSDGKNYLMVRAGNMKITVERSSGLIVNTSGGGCPDIPYLNLMLVGKTLTDAPHPQTLGKTLCGLMLERAFDEAQRLCGAQPEGSTCVSASEVSA